MIRVKRTVRQWELYSRMKGVIPYARQMNQQLSQLLNDHQRNIDQGADPVQEAIAVRDEMREWLIRTGTKFGAFEVEPQENVVKEIAAAYGLAEEVLR